MNAAQRTTAPRTRQRAPAIATAVVALALVLAGVAHGAGPPLRESQVPQWTVELGSADPEVARTAALRLARLGSAASAAALAPVCTLTHPLHEVAVAGLAWSGERKYMDRIIAALRAPSPATRRAAVWAAGGTMLSSAYRPMALLIEGSEPAVQAAAVDAMGLARLNANFETIARLGLSESTQVRAASLRALGSLTLWGAPILREERLQAEPDPQVIAQGKLPLALFDDGGGPCALERELETPALSELAHDPDAVIDERAVACVVLGQRGEVAALWPLIDHGPRIVRAAAAFGLAMAGVPVPDSVLRQHWRALTVVRGAHDALRAESDGWLLDTFRPWVPPEK
jgi:hypothetical protein